MLSILLFNISDLVLSNEIALPYISRPTNINLNFIMFWVKVPVLSENI